MSQTRWDDVDAFIVDALVGSDDALDGALADSRAAGLPEIAVAPNQGKLLHLIARAIRARRILEIGTLGGYSTIWLARALPDDGSLISLELDPSYAEIARKNVARAGLQKVVEVRVGPAMDSLDELISDRADPFDVIFIDADKDNYAEYFMRSVELSRPGTLIVGDNVVREGDVLDASHSDPRVRGIRRFYQAVGAEPRVTATAIQTVGTKGYDGFAFVLVEG